MDEDRSLTALLKAGSTDALEKLIARWRPGAEAYARGMLHDPQAAEDAAQEAFARIYAVRSGLDEERPFSACLFTVLKRICIDELRKKRHGPDLPGELPEQIAESAESEYIRRWERLDRIHLLAELDGKDREILLSFALGGKPTKQIAAETGMTDGQVRVRLHRIRRKLRKGMNGHA